MLDFWHISSFCEILAGVLVMIIRILIIRASSV